jgi:hypothetical protein
VDDDDDDDEDFWEFTDITLIRHDVKPRCDYFNPNDALFELPVGISQEHQQAAVLCPRTMG